MTRQLRIDSTGTTHPGQVRTNNEDGYSIRPEHQLWMVADGMGGHENGEWASAEIVAAFDELDPSPEFDPACADIAAAIHAANARIFGEGQRRGIQMGSTVVALHLNADRFGIFWVGDSRAYVLRGGTLHRLTRDHSRVQEMVDRGLLEPDAAASHPMSHVLARAIGVQASVELDAITDEAEPGDVFLLCSDGLTNRVSDAEIAALLESLPLEGARDRLIALTLERGAPDNVTAVLVGVSETTMLSLTPSGTLA